MTASRTNVRSAELRGDGRRPDQLRPARIETGVTRSAEGSARVTMGETVVLCAATVEERVPGWMKNSGRGWVTAEYGMLPRSSPQRIPRESVSGKQGGRTHEIQRLIGRSLRAVVDLGALGERMVTVDCDVLEADGGTRTASVTGAAVALHLALSRLVATGSIPYHPMRDLVTAVSVGMVGGSAVLDLDYAEDSTAAVDMNLVMTGALEFVEIQGTAETTPFTPKELNGLLAVGKKGIRRLLGLQRRALGLPA